MAQGQQLVRRGGWFPWFVRTVFSHFSSKVGLLKKQHGGA